jgi:hypothetical protein
VQTFDLTEFISKLSIDRPVFHSEADFQHALAWRIHQEYPEASMRLEFKPLNIGERMYIDIWVVNNEITTAIELKYKTRSFSEKVKGENFELTDQSAQDQGRYDFLKDIQRLQKVVSKNNVEAYAVFLTNDSSYWKDPLNKQTVDADFRIHDGRVLNGKLKWGEKASMATKNDREDPILINGTYTLKWEEYSKFSTWSYGNFKYLLVKLNTDK